MKSRLQKIVIILGLILLFVSFVDFGTNIYNINNGNTLYLKELRSTYSDTISDSEYEAEILPLHIKTYKHNEKVMLIYRLIGIVLVTGIGLALLKVKERPV